MCQGPKIVHIIFLCDQVAWECILKMFFIYDNHISITRSVIWQNFLVSTKVIHRPVKISN